MSNYSYYSLIRGSNSIIYLLTICIYVCYKLFKTKKHFVSPLETSCFCRWNNLFPMWKQLWNNIRTIAERTDFWPEIAKLWIVLHNRMTTIHSLIFWNTDYYRKLWIVVLLFLKFQGFGHLVWCIFRVTDVAWLSDRPSKEGSDGKDIWQTYQWTILSFVKGKSRFLWLHEEFYVLLHPERAFFGFV